MVLLGLSTMGSSAASIFIDNKLIAAVEEERITRVKNDGSFPAASIKECLRITGLTLDQVDVICIYWKPYKVTSRFLATVKKSLSSPDAVKALYSLVSRHFIKSETDDKYPEATGKWSELFNVRSVIEKKVGPYKGKIEFFDHHLTHQLYGEAIRNWDKSLTLSYDGGGEEYSTVVSVRKGNHTETIKNIKWPNSLGHFYSYFTGYLGFKMQEGEYKMMGLAPYGKPIFKKVILDEILRLKPNGDYDYNYSLCDYHAALNDVFNEKVAKLIGPPRNHKDPFTEHHNDLACSVQAAFEECQHHILKWAKSQYPDIDKLVVSGGCALNVTANGKILEAGLFKEIIVPPSPHDAGCAIGAILAHLHKSGYNFKNLDTDSIANAYLGASFTDDEIEAAFKELNLPVPPKFSQNDLTTRVAQSLSEGKIISWFQGKAEFGPRALGARSFLADPRKDEIREEINQKIKKRELFRPFAPSTTVEAYKNFFELDQESPYMNIVAKVRVEKRTVIPAVTHIDSTARVHTVSTKSNQIYHELITKFGEITGVPVLLNTSFNIQEPIVYIPSNAIKTFLNSGVDLLAIGSFICDDAWRNSIK